MKMCKKTLKRGIILSERKKRRFKMADKLNSRCCLVALVHLHLILCTAAAGKIIYVDDDVTSENNGSSWENAYVYLQDALADANSAEKPVEIRVAQGVYTPDRGAGITRGDPFVTFQLINGVTVLGGFAGVGAIEPDARYIEEYKAILSGDLAGDDADVEDPNELSGHPTRAENSYSVVNVWDTDETAVLDGVTITACVTCIFWHGSPSVNNCTFTNSDSGIAVSYTHLTLPTSDLV